MASAEYSKANKSITGVTELLMNYLLLKNSPWDITKNTWMRRCRLSKRALASLGDIVMVGLSYPPPITIPTSLVRRWDVAGDGR
ncbi:hypothetical protein AVEN_4271-1 [Araneus ventricosus]|uniref:Uncharacterized protein n=1 Tax=Araneus ventricosus TaxID=182803 RepID=A0A4Y2RRR2_ARAVE|nr:hypothetical protein AVEN_4271-1 [Araneus ventricosus]